MRIRTRVMTLLGSALALVVTGCSHLPSIGATGTMVATTHMTTMTLQLGDMPSGFQLAVDNTLSNAQLAQQVGAPATEATLNQLKRRTGTYRAFIYMTAEPSTINGPTQATVEVDFFDTQAHAQDWLVTRQTARAAAGPLVTVGVPGQRHFTRMVVQPGENIVMTNSVMAFTEQNVYVEVRSVLLGPGPSLAENERYANLIDTRILQG